MAKSLRAPIYSGPSRTGTCACGHRWPAHALRMVREAGQEAVVGGKEWFWVDGCKEGGCGCDGYHEHGHSAPKVEP